MGAGLLGTCNSTQRGEWRSARKAKVGVGRGCGSGLVGGCASRLGRDGATIAGWDLNGDAAAETVKLIEAEGGKAKAYACDAAAKDSIDSILAKIRADLGPVLILVNNAGITDRKSTRLNSSH